MIKIRRGEEPEFLRSDKIKYAKERLYKSFQDDARQERARFDTSLLVEIRPQLLDMCHNKCAYCESRIGITDIGDIENFRPKADANTRH